MCVRVESVFEKCLFNPLFPYFATYNKVGQVPKYWLLLSPITLSGLLLNQLSVIVCMSCPSSQLVCT